MKKILALTLVVLALVFALASCGGKHVPPTTTTATTTQPPVHIHNYAEWEIIQGPTCTEKGEKVRYCYCGEKQSEGVLALGHTSAEAVEENRVDATCTEKGSYDEVVYCANCGTQMSRTKKVIDALGHTESEWIVDEEATTTTQGSKHTECTVCGETIRTEAIEKLPKPASEGLEFGLNDDGQSYSVTGIGTCTDKDIIIPYTYNGLPITSIADNSFSDYNYTKKLTSIVIPNTVISIGECAFICCASLTEIIIPDSVTTIGSMAFCECSSLKTITLPNNLTSISGGLFMGDISLENITIPDSVTTIGMDAFSGCASLTTILIPESVTIIGDYAFGACYSLTNISIPTSVTNIPDGLFNSCTSLKTITIPSSITNIGQYAFSWCTSLNSITIPDSVNYIGYCSFAGCSSLETIVLPFVGDRPISLGVRSSSNTLGYIFGSDSYDGGVKTVQYYNDRESTEYRTYYIPESLKTVIITKGHIPYGSFYNCSNFTHIILGEGVTSIDKGAFQNCTSLVSVTFKNPSGWCYTLDTFATNGTNISSTDLTNTTTAAQYLTSTYYNYIWKRN